MQRTARRRPPTRHAAGGRAERDARNELQGKAAKAAMQEYVDLIESLK
ncbi:MAG TPA: hypothetical protein PKC97_07235 [Burkholderiaceae bacterium]|nr:hypothetical protein [Burkholderiaceae bacterium]